MSNYVTRCPYCGSEDIIAGPFEMYCQDCGESWPNIESWFGEDKVKTGGDRGNEFTKKATKAITDALTIAGRDHTTTRTGLGGIIIFKGGKLITEIVKHMIF